MKGKNKKKKGSEVNSGPKSWLLKGLEFEKRGQFDKAVECYKNAIVNGKKDKEVYSNIALAYQAMGDFKNAEAALDAALKIDSEYAVAWETKGYLYASINKLDEAIGFFQKAIGTGGDKAEIWVALGIIHAAKLKLEDALEFYQKALALDPENVNALNNGGLVYHMLSQLREERESIEMLEKAVNYFERALSADPNREEIWNNYGVVLGFLGRFKASLRAFDKAIMLNREYGYAYFNRARIYLQMGNQGRAVMQLKKALEIDESLYEEALEDLTLKKMKNTSEFRWLMQNKPKKNDD